VSDSLVDAMHLAAVLFVVASLGVAVFQVALVCGAPWGEYTLGGKWRGRLPGKVRVAPLVSVVLLCGFSTVILARANLAFAPLREPASWLAWVVVGYCGVGSLANAITPSRRERVVWLPVVLLMLATSLIVALA
jgi:hypothetical protein